VSHPVSTVLDMSTMSSGSNPSSGYAAQDRWRLNRAGIVNVYQYENEVLHFGGGRLLLRGVNGSGKSTAMNMLLPFLLTTHQGRIDAAGEQTGILKSWMLSGRDDAQPVGYLWIEFERAGRFLVCGCGIKANRQSDTVKTWWFITSKRPGIDFRLVEAGGVPLSATRLRAVVEPDEVFGERRRRDYRRVIEQRLFGGASVSQHMRLIDRVRTPRVGDRIDLDLPAYLVGALPQLSEQALLEAASPLDDLEEHRRNVAELEKTSGAIRGLLDVYRSYCLTELRERVTTGSDALDALRRCDRDETATLRAAEEAASEVERLDVEIGGLDHDTRRLRSEIAALEESRVYRSGRELDGLRDLVSNFAAQHEGTLGRVAAWRERVEAEAQQMRRARSQSRADLARLNRSLAEASERSEGAKIDQRPPGPVVVPEDELAGIEASEPTGDFETAAPAQRIVATDGAILRRQADIEDVDQARDRFEAAELRLGEARSRHEAAESTARRAAERSGERTRRLATARGEWARMTKLWASRVRPIASDAGVETPAVFGWAGDLPDEDPDIPGDHEDASVRLLSEIDGLAAHWQAGVAEIEQRLRLERLAVEEERALVEELKDRNRLDLPLFGWQVAGEYCLADLLDFAPHLGDAEQAGVEAALESSGLLSARLIDSTTAELASGELVAIVTGGVPRSLSDYLTARIPDRLLGEIDEGLVAKLLESITWDIGSDAANVIATDGSFRVGSLRGRHSKSRAEFIGSAARSAALDRARNEARERLSIARSVVTGSEAELAERRSTLDEIALHRSNLPSTRQIVRAEAEVDSAAEDAAAAEAEMAQERERLAEAERASAGAWDALQRVATTLSLPVDRRGIDVARSQLLELRSVLERCRSGLDAVKRSVRHWRDAVVRWRAATRELQAARETLAEDEARLSEARTRLATNEKNVGREYADVVAVRDTRKTQLTDVEARLPIKRRERDQAVESRAEAQAAARAATTERVGAEKRCEGLRTSLTEVLATPGLLGSVGESDDSEAIIARSAGSDGLREMLRAIERLLPDDPAEATSADGVRQSLMRRRDSLGAGWDAEARRPDQTLPLLIEVNGPLGKAPLADSVRVVSQQHQQMSSLLDRKQSDALRGLLQGMIAREIAEKIHRAGRLVELMNRRLHPVTTAHQVGVRLRWRRSPELDQTTARMVDLLSKRPDLRTEEEETELRRALSERLDEARALEPDVAYRQLIADTLDYKKWHEMSVMVRRWGSREKKLSRRTPLSEGEKKLVTYLPLFAAVAASYDALAEQNNIPEGSPPGIARFVLLDDAFAKVSEDNHPALFGLLVELDLDFLATSERLWGVHSEVPELAITEVVRDASLGAILLDHYRWSGTALELAGVS